MTAPMTEVSNAQIYRRLRSVKRLVLATIAATGLAIFTQYAVSSEARQRNCANVESAFAAYTDALAASFGLAPNDPKVTEFRAAYEPALEECA